jgi:hypothetical protein
MSDRDMVDVEIVYAHDPDTDGPDVARIGTIEQYPKNVARGMVNTGEARWPVGSTQAKPLDQMGRAELVSEARVRGIAIDPRGTRTDIYTVVSKAVAEQTKAAEEEQRDELSSLTKDELREQYPAAADQPANATKAELIAAVEEARTAEQADTDGTDDAGNTGSPQVTVAPGAENNPDRDQTTTTGVTAGTAAAERAARNQR